MPRGTTAAPESAKGCGAWQSEEGPFRIEYSWALLEEMARQSAAGIRALAHGGLEVGGALYGVREGNLVRVTACAEFACKHARGPGFLLSENDLVEFAKLPAPPGLQAVGWYSSRARRGLEMDDDDRAIFDGLFPWSGAIAVLIKPAAQGPARAAFCFRDRKGDLCPAPERDQVEIETGSGPGGSGSPAGDLPPVHLPPAPSPRPVASGSGPRFAPGWLWIAAATLATLALVVAVGLRLAPPKPMGLRVYAIGPGQVGIEWDRGARAIRTAHSGVLEIEDGTTRLRVPLSAEQLRLSSITYLHRSAQVTVRLLLERSGAGGSGGEESIAFQAKPAAAEPAARRPQATATAAAAPAAAAPAAAPTEAPLRIPALAREADAERMVVVDVKPPPKPFREPTAPQKATAFQAPPSDAPPMLAAAPVPAATIPLPPSFATAPPAPRAVAGNSQMAPASAGPAGRGSPPSGALPPPASSSQVSPVAGGRSTPPSAALPPSASTPQASPAPGGRAMPPSADLPQPASTAQVTPAPGGRSTPLPTPAAKATAYNGPRSGRLIWTGSLGRRGVVEIEGARASVGSLTGALPGQPVSLHVSLAELGAGGLVVYITDAMANQRREPPSAANGWNATRFEWDPARAGQLAVLEAPNPSNGFARLVVRSDARNCSVIVIDWSVP